MLKFRLVRQPEIAYITESGRAYGEDDPPRMAWAAPSGRLFRGGWEEIGMGFEPQALAQRLRQYLIDTR